MLEASPATRGSPIYEPNAESGAFLIQDTRQCLEPEALQLRAYDKVWSLGCRVSGASGPYTETLQYGDCRRRRPGVSMSCLRPRTEIFVKVALIKP